MKDLLKILGYFLGTLILGCLLAPPLFQAGQSLGQVLPFIPKADFEKYFHRAVLLAALALLPLLARSLRIRSLAELGMEKDPAALRHYCFGFAASGLTVLVMATGYVLCGFYRFKSVLPWEAVPKILLSALAVGFLEEAIFRGILQGVFQRSFSRIAALVSATLIFSSLHFLRAEEAAPIPDGSVCWSSAFTLLPGLFYKFKDPARLLSEWTTLTVFGAVLGLARMQTRAIWASAGLHTGLVFVKMAFSKFSKRTGECLPFIGSELQIGLVPVAALLICGCVVGWRLSREKRGTTG
ncbi:MAG: hypothetical protein RLZZ253_802 [Verrucomicrobiota bacterium]